MENHASWDQTNAKKYHHIIIFHRCKKGRSYSTMKIPQGHLAAIPSTPIDDTFEEPDQQKV